MAERPGLFDVIARKMDWLAQRQKVLSENVANADTPGFAAKDLREGPFERMIRGQLAIVQPRRTDPEHLTPASTGNGQAREHKPRDRYETAPSGNAVVLEEQLVKVQQTQIDYQTMTNLYSKHLRMFSTALGRGG
ncbi:flagellar basal body rod protein FlgB [Algihabitans albus]|uniref:flagellar basal body rod protein FlgB n=1 Tax=Algihabitans albus TaxID=2164067 RepID=UPI001F1B2A11|nr:flagellar basal body protein [Algihabitans albus]